MNTFQKRTAQRIALVTLLLTAVASPLAWHFARESAEKSIVSLAIEESGRLLHRFNAIQLNGPDAQAHAQDAARIIVGGMFDIAEIYDGQGKKLSEEFTPEGQAVEEKIPSHGAPDYAEASYESLKLDGGLWVLRVFVPLRAQAPDPGGRGTAAPITGFFEGVRVVPEWQRAEIMSSSLSVALMVSLTSLLCGAAIFPVVVRLSRDNERKTQEVLDSHISMMEALGRAIAKRDSDTGAHNYRVAWIASGIGERMGLRGSEMQSLIAGSFLHDVGKIGIPDAILLKPGRLDDEELKTMRTHVTLGEQVVKGMGWLDGANAVVASHHEKWNGTGYPRGLAAEQIPLSARIFAVADVFDALCSRRPYKDPMPMQEVMDILQRDTGSHFDPAVMQVFLGMVDEANEKIVNASEDRARQLLEERVRAHF